jgi:protein O-mannosyl-transferase
MQRFWNTWRVPLLCALLGALTLALYWPITHYSFIGYDDPDYVTDNPRVQSGLSWANVAWAVRTGHASNWHPLTWLSHMADVQLFGLNPGRHHLTSLALHLLNTLLLFLLLQRLTGAVWRCALVAALFAWHPLHVESVAWVAERKDVLCTFFFLLTLAAYMRYVETRRGERGKRKARSREQGAGGGELGEGRRENRAGSEMPVARITNRASRITPPIFYCLSLLLFALGLMSKPMLVTLPFLLLLLDYWPLDRFQIKDQRSKIKNFLCLLSEKLPFLSLAIASSIITLRVQNQGGTISSLQEYTLPGRMANAVASYLRYLGSTVWPADLAVFYPHPAISHLGQWPAWEVWAGAALLVALSALALLRLRPQPWFAVGWFWYLGTLLPVIGIIQVGSQAMADRYTYIPLIGIFIIGTWAVAEFLSARPLSKFVGVGLGVGLVVALFVVAQKQVRFWEDDFSLFNHALTVNERNAPAHAILGTAFGRLGKYGLGLAHARAAVRADPSYAGAWHTLGDLDNAVGKPQDALRDYQTALRFNPDLAYTWFRLAYVCSTVGKPQDAVQDYQAVLRLNPNLVPAHFNLGAVFWSLGRHREALAEFAAAVQLQPNSPENRCTFGTALADDGKPVEAAVQLAEAVRLRPGYLEALLALAGVLARNGKLEQAQARLQEVVRLRPADPEVRLAIGSTLQMAGRTNEAATAFAEALRLNPAFSTELMESAKALVNQGQLEAASSRFTLALGLRPDNADAHLRFGLVLAQRGKLDEAVSHLRDSVRLAPGAESHYHLGLVLAMQGKLPEAAANYQLALRANPDSSAALNDLAWIRATAPQAELRDGAQAVRLAEHACELTGGKNTGFLSTLAAAYAEAGRFPEAIQTAERAQALSLAGGDQTAAQAAEARLSLYRAGKPFRQSVVSSK